MTDRGDVLVEARALLAQNRAPDAVRLLRHHLERHPADRDAEYVLGLAAYGAKDDELALASFRRCLDANPDDALAQFGLDMAMRRQSEMESSLESVETQDGTSSAEDRTPLAPPYAVRTTAVASVRARRRHMIIAVAAAVLLASVLILLIRGTGHEPRRLDAIQVGDSPDGVATSDSIVWVANRDGTVSRIDPGRHSTRQIPIGIGSNLDSIEIGGGSVWVTGESEGKVAQLDARSGSVVDRIVVGGRPKGLAIGLGSVWVANCHDGAVSRIPIEPGAQPLVIHVGGRPRSVAVGHGRVYVAVRPRYPGCGVGAAAGRVAMLDRNGTVLPQQVAGIGDPSDVALTKDWLWVAERSRDRVLRVDPVAGTIEGDPVDVAADLVALVADEDVVWALSRDERSHIGKITRIDTRTVAISGSPLEIDGSPQELAVGQGRVWVTQAASDQVSPIAP